MKRIFNFLNKAMSATGKCPEDLTQGRFATESAQFDAGPRFQRTGCPEQPRDTVQILDISTSMGCPDYNPTRLDGGIKAAIEYINNRLVQCPKDRIAVVTFNTKARIVLPLTPIVEAESAVAVLQKLKPDGGTDIAEGLQAAIQIYRNRPMSSRARRVILLTDGHGGNPISKAAQLKKQHGAVIDVVGIGGTHKAVKESLLRRVATTDPDGFNHYHFIADSAKLKQHYRQLATGLVWRGGT